MRFGAIRSPADGRGGAGVGAAQPPSCGVGEFPDLAALGAWAAGVGIEVIQLLPVNDTGTNSSPYSALSAFALHPLYLRLEDVPGAERYAAEIAAWRRKAEARPRLDYPGTLAFKLSVLERIHRDRSADIGADAGLAAWIADNPWVRPYAAFRVLERAHGGAPWETLGRCGGRSRRPPSRASWDGQPEACRFHAWVQREAGRPARRRLPWRSSASACG